MVKKRYPLFSFIMPLVIGFLQVTCFDYSYGWLGIFLYSLLFFTVRSKPLMGFLQGFLYGVVYFTLHSWGLTTFIDINGFAFYYKCIPILFYVIHALYSALWIMGLSIAKKYTQGWMRYLLYVHITCLYMWWLHYKTLMIFFIDMGSPLVFSLIPCINNSTLTYLFYVMGLGGATYIIILMNGLLTYILEKKEYVYYGSTVGITIALLTSLSVFTQYKSLQHDDSDEIIHIQSPCKSNNMHAMMEELYIKVNKKLKQRPMDKELLLVFSESTLPFCFSQKTLQMLSDNILYDSRIQIMLGGFYQRTNDLYNSIFLLQRRRIILHYDKKKLIPFWEFIPNYEKLPLNYLFGTFLRRIKPFSGGSTDTYNFFYYNKELYVTLLCSELFWTSFANYSSDINLMCLLNDSYFEGSLLQRIMLLYGRFVAGTQRRKIFYMATLNGYLIGKNGAIIKKL